MHVKIMKIINYKKKKNNIYEITLSNNEKISLYDDVILKYNLLLTKELNDKLKSKIYEENSYLESYYKALKYLNSKLRTEKEIRKKLSDYNSKIVDYTIDRLYKEGYINNKIYIKSFVNDQINFKLVGQNKIKKELLNMGLNDIEIDEYINSIETDIWLDKINKYILKKINSNHNLSGLNLKHKIYQDLMIRGFKKEDINTIINEFDFKDDIKIIEKEYQKIKNKLSKKYSGEELEYRIKIYLIKKGFKKDLE